VGGGVITNGLSSASISASRWRGFGVEVFKLEGLRDFVERGALRFPIRNGLLEGFRTRRPGGQGLGLRQLVGVALERQ
jgi:hypothetical protein